MHSSRRFEGKLTERWGRKASGLRDLGAYDSGVAGANLKLSSGRGLRTEASSFELHHLRRRAHTRPRQGVERLQSNLDHALHKSLSGEKRIIIRHDAVCGKNATNEGILPFREPSHVQFNFVLIYSAGVINAGRALSGVTY
jgi:hypothetical protein